MLKLSNFMSAKSTNILYPSLLGFCALAIGLGLGRFAYTPLAPLMEHRHNLTQQAAHLAGVINFWGYFFGIILANLILLRLPAKKTVLLASILCIFSLVLSAVYDHDYPFIFSHALSGISGALIMISTPVYVSRSVNKQQKVRVFGLMFAGVGFGIVCSAIISYYSTCLSVSNIWIITAITGIFLFTIMGICLQKIPKNSIKISNEKKIPVEWSYIFILFALAYSLFAVGMTPHFVFIEEYMANILSVSQRYIDFAWLSYGLCIMFGTPLVTYIAQKTSNYRMLIYLLLLASMGLFQLLFFRSINSLILSYCLCGLSAMSIVSLISSALASCIDTRKYPAHWSLLTISFSLWQSITSSIYDWWLNNQLSYSHIFLTSGAALVASSICILLVFIAQRD